MRILIAEDDPISKHVLTVNLTQWGHEVVATTNGIEAWTILSGDEAPQLAILDWMMPGIEGTEICRRVRELSPVIPTYIILLTARRGVEEVVQGMQAGADDYLTKPYHRDELRVRLQVGIRMIELQSKLAKRIDELAFALEQVKRLEGILPICGYCRNIRDDGDQWQDLESYISTHTEAAFSHGICPTCLENVVKPQIIEFKQRSC